jgi:hypothetical protein
LTGHIKSVILVLTMRFRLLAQKTMNIAGMIDDYIRAYRAPGKE